MVVLPLFIAIPSAIDAYIWWEEDRETKYFIICIGESILFAIFAIFIWIFSGQMEILFNKFYY